MIGGFDRLARAYRWMEYGTFGGALQRCRLRFLHQLTGAQHALLLGDGDGRFAASLLRAASDCRVRAVDCSPRMLRALSRRCGSTERLRCDTCDLREGLPDAIGADRFDVVATHFFLDCLTTAEVERLVAQVRRTMAPDSCWLLSEFNLPPGRMRVPALLIVRSLYLAFRLLTGLRVQRLPDHRSAMERHGLVCRQRAWSLGGLLVAELWMPDANFGERPTL